MDRKPLVSKNARNHMCSILIVHVQLSKAKFFKPKNLKCNVAGKRFFYSNLIKGEGGLTFFKKNGVISLRIIIMPAFN